MHATRRIIIVRRGDEELLERLRKRFAGQPETVVRYDRRTGSRRRARQPTASERRRGERRLPHPPDPGVLPPWCPWRESTRRQSAAAPPAGSPPGCAG